MLEVGRIDRAHGVRGEVVVTLITDLTERLAPGSVLETDAGLLAVVASKPHQHRWIVTFAGVADRASAEALHGLVLRAEPVDDADALWVHELIGAEVLTTGGDPCGRVAWVEDNPASPILVLEGGAMVPVVFVVDQSGLPDRLVIDAPEGLFELGR